MLIQQSAASQRLGTRFEGDVANTIIENYATFCSIIGLNEKIARRDNSTLAELDIHLDDAIMECTLRPGSKAAQAKKYLMNVEVNPMLKPVVLYAPNYTENAQKQLPREVIVTRDLVELGNALFAIKAASLGWVKKGRSKAR